jgi:hypothetical protein
VTVEEQEPSDKKPPGRRRPGILLLLVLLGAAGVWRYARPSRFDPRSSEVGRRLGVELPVLLAALAQARGPEEVDGAILGMRQRTMTPEIREFLGGEGSARLEATLVAAREVTVRQGTFSGQPSQDFLKAAGALGQTLLDRQSPYFFDGDVHSSRVLQPLLLSFYVEREARVQVGEQTVSALHVWRLDPLNLSQSALGYVRPTTPAALVLLDQIETELVRYVLPAIPEKEAMILVDEESLDDDEPWQRSLHEGAARVVRETFSAGEDPAQIREVGAILARRRALVERWRRSTAALRKRMHVPERLIPEADYRTDLDKLVPRAELIEWDEMHERLASGPLEATFLRLRGRFAEGVERHEVQHRVDFETQLAPLPEDIREWLLLDDGKPEDTSGFGARVRQETSAFLAALAASGGRARLDLILATRYLFQRSMQGNAYSYAGLVVLSEVARHLGVEPQGPLIARRHIARGEAARLLLGCVERPDARVAEAASKGWSRLFGRPLPEARVLSARSNRGWRR